MGQLELSHVTVSCVPNVLFVLAIDFVFSYLLLNFLWQYFCGVQGAISPRSHCSAYPSLSSVVQLASCVTDISHNSVRLFIYLHALCGSGVTLVESPLWVEVLARCHALPCVIAAPWRGVTYLLRSYCLRVTPCPLVCRSACILDFICACSVLNSL